MRVPLRPLLLMLATSAVAFAQEAPPTAASAKPENPLSANARLMFTNTKRFLLGSAEKMPEESYGFKPADTVRSFGQILGHAADSQYRFCSVVLGEKNPAPQIEKTKTSKADLIAALKDAFAYCDKAYDGMTDTSAIEMTKLLGLDMPKVGVLTVNTIHSVEHYGNLIVYLRMKNLVPPSSEPRGAAPQQTK